MLFIELATQDNLNGSKDTFFIIKNVNSPNKIQLHLAKHIKIGQAGEQAAVRYLKENKYTVHETNWRHSRAELDIIAEKSGMLIFVEVKTRTNDMSLPEAAVNSKKQKLLAKAASAYMYNQNYGGEFRFDVLSVYYFNENDVRIDHLEDAFFPGLNF